MNSLVIKSLCIFERESKTAKRVDFSNGINVITSDKEDGNDVGKSIILKSLYHSLGADSIFDAKWDSISKIYIVHINISQKDYYIYRSGKLFKIYSHNLIELFSTINRIELAKYLKDLFGFCVKLPNREDEELEIAPPVYSYLLSFVDQDHMNGSQFTSFKALTQYPNYKENVIYNHFGIFTDEYFETIKAIQDLKKKEKGFVEEKLIIESMLKRVKKYLQGIDAPADIQVLNVELEKSKQEYTDIVVNLKKVKDNLIRLRNEKIELENNIKDILYIKKVKEGEVKKINENVCPTCSQDIEDIGLRISKNSQLEDFYIIKDELDGLLLEVKRQITIKEELYKRLLRKFEEFENGININNTNISDVLKHRGYLETQDNMIREYGNIENKLRINSESLKTCQKTLRTYNQLKKKANELYEQYMVNSINEFGLKEIGIDKVKSVKNNFTSRGSNIPISTIIWYFNLLKVKDELNSETLKFPLVLDSPNNVELDDNKRKALFNYIFTNNNKNTQLIVSTLGFDEEDYKNIKFDNIIVLDNEKYSLLNTKDYEENQGILDIVFEN